MKGWTEEAVKAAAERQKYQFVVPDPNVQFRNQQDEILRTIRSQRFLIGLDTGVLTGAAIWDRQEKRFVRITSGTITAMMKIVAYANSSLPGGIFVRFEDARLRTWIPYEETEKDERGRREGAGSVKRDAKIWEDYLVEENIAFESVAPMNNMTKLDADRFRLTTGYRERTNEHERDAAMLVFAF